MTVCAHKDSFRSGWLPLYRSRDVTLHFQIYAQSFSVRPGELYYFKALEGFAIDGMSPDEKFEDIDAHIVDAFDCDPDDIHTLNSDKCRGVIVMPECVLREAGVALPKWPELSWGAKPARSRRRIATAQAIL